MNSESSNVALIFPGQGSQAVGMGADLYQASPAARAVFDEADDILGTHLSKLSFWGPEEELKQTFNAQPAILTASIAALRALSESTGRDLQATPLYVAGHSLGEYTALVAAEAMSFADALRLVRERGRLMQEAGEAREGTMAAIVGLDESSVELLCQQTGAEIGNINSDGQIVISGPKEAVVRAVDLSRAQGARMVVPLQVSGAFHSSLMMPAIPGMQRAIERVSIANPSVPVISNTTATPLATQNAIRSELVQQICKCVQWSRSIEYMASHGVNTFVEIGPGRVLTGLVKRIAKGAETVNVNNVASLKAFAAA